jgi:hypothetical protein
MDDPMPVRPFERVRELLRDQDAGREKVKRNEYFKKITPRLEARMLSRSFRAVQTFWLGLLEPLILNIRLPSHAVTLDAFLAVRGRSAARHALNMT